MLVILLQKINGDWDFVKFFLEVGWMWGLKSTTTAMTTQVTACCSAPPSCTLAAIFISTKQNVVSMSLPKNKLPCLDLTDDKHNRERARETAQVAHHVVLFQDNTPEFLVYLPTQERPSAATL